MNKQVQTKDILQIKLLRYRKLSSGLTLDTLKNHVYRENIS